MWSGQHQRDSVASSRHLSDMRTDEFWEFLFSYPNTEKVVFLACLMEAFWEMFKGSHLWEFPVSSDSSQDCRLTAPLNLGGLLPQRSEHLQCSLWSASNFRLARLLSPAQHQCVARLRSTWLQCKYNIHEGKSGSFPPELKWKTLSDPDRHFDSYRPFFFNSA